MNKEKFVYYQENDTFIGWFQDYPDNRTQAKDLDELKENLNDIYVELTGGKIPQVRKTGELVLG